VEKNSEELCWKEQKELKKRVKIQKEKNKK
jgi:hypothetical protein